MQITYPAHIYCRNLFYNQNRNKMKTQKFKNVNDQSNIDWVGKTVINIRRIVVNGNCRPELELR